jgi:hypothetical protein
MPGAAQQPFGDAPGSDVKHVDAEDGEHVFWRAVAAEMHSPVPIRKIDAQRATHVREAFVRTPGRDAFQMRFDVIARPPDQVRGPAGKFDDVAASPAPDLEHIAFLLVEKRCEPFPDRFTIAMEGGRIEPAIRLRSHSALAEI